MKGPSFMCILMKPDGVIALSRFKHPTEPLSTKNNIDHTGLGALLHTGDNFGIFCEYDGNGGINKLATHFTNYLNSSSSNHSHTPVRGNAVFYKDASNITNADMQYALEMMQSKIRRKPTKMFLKYLNQRKEQDIEKVDDIILRKLIQMENKSLDKFWQ